jgi:hypothetical protein
MSTLPRRPLQALKALAAAWRNEMRPADRVRVVVAAAFPFGALSHMGWVLAHGWFYYGPAPSWAVAFWYTLCVIDFFIAWAVLTHPRTGLALAAAVMVVTLWVNWTEFPTFEYGFNLVLVGLTAFGVFLAAMLPWLWLRSTWRPDATSAGKSAPAQRAQRPSHGAR